MTSSPDGLFDCPCPACEAESDAYAEMSDEEWEAEQAAQAAQKAAWEVSDEGQAAAVFWAAREQAEAEEDAHRRGQLDDGTPFTPMPRPETDDLPF